MVIGPWEIFILLVVLVIVFGAGRLSQVGGAVGRSVREFRSAVRDEPLVAQPVVVAPPVICAACQASNLASNRFCSTCGATLVSQPVAAPATEAVAAPAPQPAAVTPTVLDLEHPQPAPDATPTNTCPSCATINPPGQPFCGQCGTRLAPAAA
jgi:sec-independent protein translocase protein TatA